nr:hypothetical protein [Mycoplasmopsis bovis]
MGYTNTYEAQVHNFSRKRRIDEELDDEYVDELEWWLRWIQIVFKA